MRLKIAKTPKREAFELILGFRKIERPEFIESLVFPAETLTALDAEQVSDLHAKYTMLYAYANQSLADANVSILSLQNRKTERENTIFREQPRINSIEKWKRDAKLKEDEQVEYFNRSLTIHHVKRIQLEMMIANFERFIAALSRELSRKNYERKPEGF